MNPGAIPRKSVIKLMRSAMPVRRQLSDQAVDAVMEFLSSEVELLMREGERELQMFNENPNISRQNKRMNGFILQRVIDRRRMSIKDKM